MAYKLLLSRDGITWLYGTVTLVLSRLHGNTADFDNEYLLPLFDAHTIYAHINTQNNPKCDTNDDDD